MKAAARTRRQERAAPPPPVERLNATQIALIPPAYLHAINQGEQLIATAIREKVAAENLERMLAMRKQLRDEAAKGAFIDAMAGFQAECPIIKKNKKATIKKRGEPQTVLYEYSYAELDYMVMQVKPLIRKYGFSYRIQTEYLQSAEWAGGLQKSTCIVTHVLGHMEVSEFTAPIDKNALTNDMQKAAAAASFGKRQCFANAFGILTSDKDVDGAGTEGEKGAEQQQRQDQRGEPRAKAVAPGGDPTKPMPDGKQRIVRARLEGAGITDAIFMQQFKKPLTAMMDNDYDRIVAWVREMQEARA